jgi:putative transposase
MRLGQFTIDGQDVEQCAAEILGNALELKDHGHKCRASVLLHLLLYAAARITSLFDACGRLKNVPKDDAVRKALVATLPEIDKLQRQLNAALRDTLPRSLRRHLSTGKGKWRLAIDLTLIPYHGEPLLDHREVYRGEAKSGTTHFHAYGTCYVVHHGRRFTLAMVRVELGTPMHEVLRQLLAEVRVAGIMPHLLLLDRGFVSVGVIRYLQAARIAFLMPAVMRGRKPDDPRGPSATYVFAARRTSGWDRYSWRDAEGVKATVRVCICRTRSRRGRRGRRCRPTTLVYFFWGMQPPSLAWVRETYRRRFGIESSYRQLNQARIRTSTRDPKLRLLFVGVALVLRNVWVWFHLLLLSEPRRGRRQIRLERMRFRTMLLWLIHLIESLYDTHDQAMAHAPPKSELMETQNVAA